MPSTIGDYIRVQRAQRHLTLQQVADRVGLSKAYLSELERGRRIGSAEIWKSIGRELECALDVLVNFYAMDAKRRAEREWKRSSK
jgi:transcriptional regulator with XRE-family HTH domain